MQYTKRLSFLFLAIVAMLNWACTDKHSEEKEKKWAETKMAVDQLNAAYQRRYDVIRDMIKMAEQVPSFSKEKNSEILSLLDSIRPITIADHMISYEELNKTQEAQKKVTGYVSGLLNDFLEAPAEMKENDLLKDLQARLEGAENRIFSARRKYNEVANEYNDIVKEHDKLPVLVINGPFKQD
jgi:LemA protein